MAFALPKRKSVRLRHKVRVGRLACFLQGLSVSAWAPLIPFIAAGLNLDTAEVTALVFSFGAGSVSGMLLVSVLIPLRGPRGAYLGSVLTIALPLIALAQLPAFTLTLPLSFILGMGVGGLDIWGSIYGAYLEKHYRIRVIGPLYALFSLGEILGAGLVMLLLTLRLEVGEAIPALFSMVLLTAIYYVPCVDRELEGEKSGGKRVYLLPRGVVIPLSLTVAIIFMAGGAMVDWSGLYLNAMGLPLDYASSGYLLVSVAMCITRFFSNSLVRRLSELRLVLGGTLLTAAGLALSAFAPSLPLALTGFILTGAGMGNISPLTIRAVTRQQTMPMVAAVAVLSITGYAALLLGPALLGITAQAVTLKGVFILLSLLALGAAFLVYRTRALYR